MLQLRCDGWAEKFPTATQPMPARLFTESAVRDAITGARNIVNDATPPPL
jgi:hypothetical protein